MTGSLCFRDYGPICVGGLSADLRKSVLAGLYIHGFARFSCKADS